MSIISYFYIKTIMSTLNNTLFTVLEENSSEQFNENNTLVTDLVPELVTYPFPEDFNNFH